MSTSPPRRSGRDSVRSLSRRLPAPRVAAVAAAGALALLAPSFASPQEAPPEEWLTLLERVLPQADRYTDRQGRPPVFAAYRTDRGTGQESLVGYAFVTSDLPPEQKGFNGPIEVLVGMDLRGVLTGIVVTDYIESHKATRGDFLAAEGFQEQFTGKSIVDAFQVRRDVDGITGATITVDAMSRGIRNAAREVALAYRLGSVSSDSEEAPLDPVSVTLAELERLSWTQMLLRGLAQRISVLDDDRIAADLTLLYLRDEAVAEAMIGPGTWSEVLERAGPLVRERHMVLAGVDGPSAGSLNLARLSIAQGADTAGLAPADVLLFGSPREGKLDGQVRMLRVLFFERSVDMTRPFVFVLDLRPGLGLFSADYPGERSVRVRSAPAREEEAQTGAESDVPAPNGADDAVQFPGTSSRLVVILALVVAATAAYATKRLMKGARGASSRAERLRSRRDT